MTRSIPLGGALLVVEDSDDDYETLCKTLAMVGFSGPIVRVETGEGALELLDAGVPLPGLILLDLNLPSMDGRELLVRIKSHDRLRSIPTVVYTTSTSPRDIEFCFEHHANAYHAKAMDLDVLERQVRELVSYWGTSVVLPRAWNT